MKDKLVGRRWECFSDAGYFDMWCVRRVGERTFGAGFHVINRESAEPLRDYLESLEAKLEKARGALEPFGNGDLIAQIRDDESDEEWAKFRLLIKDYRRAAQALKELSQ